MFNKIIVILILILMIVSTLAPVFAFAKGQMEPEGRMFSQPFVETIENEPVTTGSAKDYSQKKEVVLDDILCVYPDTLDDPEAVVVGYKLTAVDMPVTFPFYVLVDEEKDTYSATELGLSPILWCGDEYVTKAWVGTGALDNILRSKQKMYFSTIKEMRFIVQA